MIIPRLLASCAVFWALLSPALAADQPDPAGVDFFEKKIRPVLAAHCYKCHAADAKSVKGGLLLDSRQGLLTGGDTGPAIVPGNVEESLLIATLRYGDDSYQMPPAGKLPDAIIADFEKWIEMGAPDPRVAAAAPARKEIDLAAGRQFWSFQKPQSHPQPTVKHHAWVRQPLDAFILAKLEAAGLSPAAQADKHTLLRRAYFDLIGLPPTPAEVRAFLADEAPNAYEKVIDRLLASPHYGERWGRHWLDVVRYAEDNTNMGPHNGPYEFAWRYRDWVVQALNDDVPYDQFIKRQLATDFLPETGPEDLPALGLLGLSPANHKELLMAKIEIDRCFADDWEDRVDVIGRGLLGLTLACARCHDHKFDPVSAEDYYALAGVIASSRQTTRPIISQEEIKAASPARDQVAKLTEQIKGLEKDQERLAAAQKNAKSKAQTPRAKSSEGVPPLPELSSDEVQETIAGLKDLIAEIKRQTPHVEIPLANALTEETTKVEEIDEQRNRLAYYPKPIDLPLYIRGDVSKPGPIVARRFVALLSDGEPKPFEQGSGRLELAEAIVSEENPLTARVIVNRVWSQHFGTGLVSTPSNFGTEGAAPTHPELLDELAVSFMADGWSLKKLHRRIMLSATYQQTSQASAEQLAADPENRLLGRYRARRLEIEPYRDALLAASGQLDLTLGGPAGNLSDQAFHRRTIYAAVSRHEIDETLAAFDFPDPNIHCERRSVTTTPLQQLFTMNSEFMRQQAAALTERVRAESGPQLSDRVKWAHLLLFSREPTTAELEVAKQFLGEAAAGADSLPESTPDRWQRYMHALLSSNELLYVD